ncbi:proline/glycine betaine ABC transporter substrate-binding protein ProX, partial [Vibrio sp. 1580]|nr:proline/glycine betaine ABC transporter substrate-binding protein ProX [Vibrio sp. 1580]
MNNSWKKALSVGALSTIAFSTYGFAGELPGAGVTVQPVQSTVAEETFQTLIVNRAL